MSIRALAKLLQRHYKNVYDDVNPWDEVNHFPHGGVDKRMTASSAFRKRTKRAFRSFSLAVQEG
jgi:hypothetical protein